MQRTDSLVGRTVPVSRDYDDCTKSQMRPTMRDIQIVGALIVAWDKLWMRIIVRKVKVFRTMCLHLEVVP